MAFDTFVTACLDQALAAYPAEWERLGCDFAKLLGQGKGPFVAKEFPGLKPLVEIFFSDAMVQCLRQQLFFYIADTLGGGGAANHGSERWADIADAVPCLGSPSNEYCRSPDVNLAR